MLLSNNMYPEIITACWHPSGALINNHSAGRRPRITKDRQIDAKPRQHSALSTPRPRSPRSRRMRVVSPPAGVLGALILTVLHPQPSRRGTVRCCALLDARAPQLDADPDVAFVLSGYEARALLKLKKGAPATGGVAIAGPHSIDLGASSAASLLITADGVALDEPAPGGEPENSPPAASVTWDELKKIEKRGGAYKCYWPHLGYSVDKVEGFSEETQRAASLLPVDGAHRNEPRYQIPTDTASIA